jgi:hypothetical protein
MRYLQRRYCSSQGKEKRNEQLVVPNCKKILMGGTLSGGTIFLINQFGEQRGSLYLLLDAYARG